MRLYYWPLHGLPPWALWNGTAAGEVERFSSKAEAEAAIAAATAQWVASRNCESGGYAGCTCDICF